MSMRQNLQMRQGQSLVMTPQLQQAIKLLQLSNQELAEFVEAEIERNPLLEYGEAAGDPAPEIEGKDLGARKELDGGSHLADAQANLDAPTEDINNGDSAADAGMSSSIGAASGPSANTDWTSVGSGAGSRGGEEFDFEARLSADKTLREHLEDQLTLASLPPIEALIASRLIDETDEAGYCRVDLEELSVALSAETDMIAAVLKICQSFEPTGVMARDLQECLALQLAERNRLDPAMETLLANLELVAKYDVTRLASLCGVDKSDVTDMLAELKSLTPRPGGAFAGDTAVAVAPDVTVRELPSGMFAVELNSETLPRVLMNKAYYAEVSALPMRDKEKEFISECAANATWLMKSLDQRARTILRVASEIVRQQDAFFAHGIAHLKPLNLKQVADAIEMHESTVSRVTSNKYMATPRGLFELKYFFSAAIPSTGGGEAHSAEAVRYRIKSLIDAETADAVLSDDQIVDHLREFGVDIARRTVAKYRESLSIPS
ncbi:MAG: RNA polymerase factor sigma-54, partial [Pseudomonadota bacterium]